MSFAVKILADSLAPCGKRLVTYQATYPRPIHSEVLTHKMLSRCSASSRAIPVAKMIQRVVEDPWIPSYIGANQKGMQAGEELSEEDRAGAVAEWLDARDGAVETAWSLVARKVHKQVINRLLEPWMWITTIISATEWNNFFALRDHEAAEPHFQHLARMMRAAREESIPRVLRTSEWHLPMIDFDDEIDRTLSQEDLIKISVARCARVSYLTHEGRRDPQDDIRLYNDLMVKRPLHASPAEHIAMALDTEECSGNFIGFRQHRKMLPFENVPG
jgi:hypothetical protein